MQKEIIDTADGSPKGQLPFTFYNPDYRVVDALNGLQWGVGIHHNPEVQHYRELLREFADSITKRSSITKIRERMVQWKPSPRYMNQKEVIAYLGHEKIFWILVEEYGLEPVEETHKGKFYCSKHVEEKCIQFEHRIAV